MSVTMDKELLIRMPTPLYNQAKKLSKKRYKSISAFVRDVIMEHVEDYLTEDERKKIADGEKEYLKGKGISWRTIKRG
ncbi:MAG: hypothetical protein COW10_04590 [Candidatus Omnitrophica bacterium CG12_big_fil_rev_8_21_14_0_65_42_8]|nr:MAG: hypothetical protein COW10_04590 [Candidatus Omnitrophica bacterium CG12_big_fil_rev_8_21_14_0_65_42_8]